MSEEQTEQIAAPEPEEKPEAPKWSPEAEHEARALGWKPASEWKGPQPPGGLIEDPSKYLERAETFLPFRKQKERIAELERSVAGIEAASRAIMTRQKADFDAQMAKLQADKLQAVSEADTDRFKALEKQERELQKSADAAPKEPKADPHISAIAEWSADKEWFRTDSILTNAAVAAYAEAEKRTADPAKRLEYVDKKLAEYFPERFGVKPKAQPAGNVVESGLTFGAKSKTASFDALPKGTRDVYSRYVKEGWVKDTAEAKAEWVKQYESARPR